MQSSTKLENAIEIIGIGIGRTRPAYRTYPGSGGIWTGDGDTMACGRFDDWGLAVATAEILNAVIDGRLVLSTGGAERQAKFSTGARWAMARELFDIGGDLAVNCNPDGKFHGWLFRKHHDGQYISVRKLETVNPFAGDPLFIHMMPKPDECAHDFAGWRNFPDGNGGEQVCTKCGMGAMAHTLRTDCPQSSQEPVTTKVTTPK